MKEEVDNGKGWGRRDEYCCSESRQDETKGVGFSWAQRTLSQATVQLSDGVSAPSMEACKQRVKSACQAHAEGIQTHYRELGLAGWNSILPLYCLLLPTGC